MKIALINEACGVMQNLRDGLWAFGHEVLGVSTQSETNHRRYADYELGFPTGGLFGKAARCITPLWRLKKIQDYDVIQFIYQASAIPSWPTRYLDLALLKRKGAKLGYYGIGCDEVSLIRANPESGDRKPCPTCIAYDEIGKRCEKSVLSFRPRAGHYAHLFDYCVSSSVDYKHCHDFFPNAAHARIPLPVNVDKLPFIPACSKRPTKIIHAPTSMGFKGTHAILSALEIVQTKRKDFEFQIVQGLPYAEYIKVLSECDVYIDQVHSHGVGMAALENLAMGKIVLSGNSSQYKEWMPFANQSPIIHAPNSPEDLAITLLNVLDQRIEFERLSIEGRNYVDTNHGHLVVASQFLAHWGTPIKDLLSVENSTK